MQYKNPLLILDDGYESLKNTYPMCVLNPHYEPPRQMVIFDDGLENLEYPQLTDIKMKDDESMERRQRHPKIDRASKAAVLAKERQYVLNKTLEAQKGFDKVMEMEIEFNKVSLIFF